MSSCKCGAGASVTGERVGIEPIRPREPEVPADVFFIEGPPQSVLVEDESVNVRRLHEGKKYRITNLNDTRVLYFRLDGIAPVITANTPDPGVNALTPQEFRIVIGRGQNLTAIITETSGGAALLLVPLRQQRGTRAQ